MPRSPSIVPQDADHDMYIILDVFGAWVGRAWGETEDIYRETIIRDLLDGVYSYPVRIVAFNTAEGWSRNITFEIAAELKQRRAEGKDIPACVQHLLAFRPTIKTEAGLLVTVQRPPPANAGEHRRAAEIGNQHQRRNRGLPFRLCGFLFR